MTINLGILHVYLTPNRIRDSLIAVSPFPRGLEAKIVGRLAITIFLKVHSYPNSNRSFCRRRHTQKKRKNIRPWSIFAILYTYNFHPTKKNAISTRWISQSLGKMSTDEAAKEGTKKERKKNNNNNDIKKKRKDGKGKGKGGTTLQRWTENVNGLQLIPDCLLIKGGILALTSYLRWPESSH